MTTIEKTGIYLSIFVIIVLLGLIVFSKNGFLDYRSLEQQNLSIQDQVNRVESKNQKLGKEIISLKTDLDYIKHLAKHEYDMAEEDELIFKDQSDNQGD
jgi:cell division protein FtsB